MTPGVGPFLTPGAWLAGFIKRITAHCYTQNMKALGLVISEKKIFVCFSHDAPGAGPVWNSGARLVGFIKRTFIHSYTQIERLWAWWFWRRFVLCFPSVSSWELMTPGAGPFLTPGAWLAGFIKRTTIHCVRSSRIVGTS